MPIDENATLLAEGLLGNQRPGGFSFRYRINTAIDSLQLALGPFHDRLVYASLMCMYSASEGLVFDQFPEAPFYPGAEKPVFMKQTK